jgi:type II secretory pathway pseudopilin PulG
MAVLLVGLAVMSLMLSVAMPVWHQTMQREKEAELVFRGSQYARAIGLYQRRYGAGYPPDIEFLVQQKFLRKKYKDPMVDDGEFQVISAGVSQQAGQTSTQAAMPGRGQGQSQQGRGGGTTLLLSTSASGQVTGPVAGVASKNTDQSIRLYNGRNHYNEWLFIYTGPAGGRGIGVSGGRGGRGGRGQGEQQGPGGLGPGGDRGRGGQGGSDQRGRGGRGQGQGPSGGGGVGRGRGN